MIASILSTGNEVMIGDITDTNSSFLARRLTETGIFVKTIRAARDEIQDISEAITEIAAGSDLCLVTGGLGPTSDDLTAQACAAAMGETLLLNTAAFDHMCAYFQRRGFEMTPENEKQAMLPATSTPLFNENGTAPGFHVTIGRCRFFFMPGVPSEMVSMFENQVIPALEKGSSDLLCLPIERLTVFGMGESKVGAVLTGFEAAFPGISLGFRAIYPLIEVKIVAEALLSRTGDRMRKAVEWITARLGDKVISTRGLSMAQEVGRLLRRQQKTVAVAESCTGGLIANWLTDVSGSSDYFLLSAVTYSNDAKQQILGVNPSTLLECGAVHEQTAREMAQGARLKAGADFALSTTGIAGPSGGTAKKPVGMVCIGLATGDGVTARTYYFTSGDRYMNKQIFAAAALNRLRKHLVLTLETV